MSARAAVVASPVLNLFTIPRSLAGRASPLPMGDKMTFSWRRFMIAAVIALVIAAISYLLLSSDRVLPRNNAITMVVGLSNAPAAILTPFEEDGITRQWDIFAVLSFAQWLGLIWFAPLVFRKWRERPGKQDTPPKATPLAFLRVGNILFVVLLGFSLMMTAFATDAGVPTGIKGLLIHSLYYSGMGFYATWLMGFLTSLVASFFTPSDRLHFYCTVIPFGIGVIHLLLWMPTIFLWMK